MTADNLTIQGVNASAGMVATNYDADQPSAIFHSSHW